MGKIIEFSPNCKRTVGHGIIRAGHPQPETELARQGRQEVPTLEPAMVPTLAISWLCFLELTLSLGRQQDDHIKYDTEKVTAPAGMQGYPFFCHPKRQRQHPKM